MSNEINWRQNGQGQILTPDYPPCPSDYEAAPIFDPSIPTWRNHEPRYVHSLKWRDRDGIEHLHVIRSDDLGEMLAEVKTIKDYIHAARACPKPQPATDDC